MSKIDIKGRFEILLLFSVKLLMPFKLQISKNKLPFFHIIHSLIYFWLQNLERISLSGLVKSTLLIYFLTLTIKCSQFGHI